MHYLDFSGLFILAIGCNLIYIINKNNEGGINISSFFLFLRLINNREETIRKIDEKEAYTTIVLNKLKDIRETKPIGDIKKIYGEKGGQYIVDNIDIEYPASIEKYEKKIIFFTGTDKLQSMTLITFCYSFFVALLASYKLDFLFDSFKNPFNELLLQMNIIVLSVSTIMLIYGVLTKKISKKLLFNVINLIEAVLAIIIIVWLIIICNVMDYIITLLICDDILYYNYLITIFICFTGFILYTLLHIIGYTISLYYCCKPNFKFYELRKILKTEDNKEQELKFLLEDTKHINFKPIVSSDLHINKKAK